MKRIAIDCRFVSEYMVGISRHCYELIKEYIKKNDDICLFLLVNNELIIKNILCRKSNIKILKVKSKPLSFYENIEIPYLLIKYRIDLFHATAYIAPIFIPIKFVYTIHDTYHLIFPDYFSKFAKIYFLFVVKRHAKKAKSLITISNNSKNDIKKYLNIKRTINVIYLGSPEKDLPEKKEIISKEEEYFLFIGNSKWHKNSSGVLEAYSLFYNENKNIPKIFLNINRYPNKETEIQCINCKKKINFLGTINENNLNKIYNGALCLVIPSFYEGFGLIILEAMKYGIPVITSNVSSMPEIGGDAVYYVNPYNKNEIKDAMKIILCNESIRNSLINKGKERCKKFSWEKCAEKTYSIYKNILTLQ